MYDFRNFVHLLLLFPDRTFLSCLVCSHWRIKCNNICKAPRKRGSIKEGFRKHHAFIPPFPSPSSLKRLFSSFALHCNPLLLSKNHSHCCAPNKAGQDNNDIFTYTTKYWYRKTVSIKPSLHHVTCHRSQEHRVHSSLCSLQVPW